MYGLYAFFVDIKKRSFRNFLHARDSNVGEKVGSRLEETVITWLKSVLEMENVHLAMVDAEQDQKITNFLAFLGRIKN